MVVRCPPLKAIGEVEDNTGRMKLKIDFHVSHKGHEKPEARS
jgi:hypothetical protein